MSRTPPQARIDESNRSLDQIRGYGDDNEVSSPIERLNRDGQGGLQIYSTTINVDIDDAEEESQVSERLDIKTIGEHSTAHRILHIKHGKSAHRSGAIPTG